MPPYCGRSTINEGAYFIESGDRLFIIYSGNGCWSDDYVLGLIEYTGGDFLSADSWVKDSVPFMVKGNGNYGPGHATFFYSPDRTELWHLPPLPGALRPGECGDPAVLPLPKGLF